MTEAINEIFKKHDLDSSLLKKKQIKSASIYLEDSKKDCIFFYFLKKDTESKKKFLDRLKRINSGLVITTLKIKESFEYPVIVVEKEKFFSLQIDICNALYPLPKDIKICAITGTDGKTTTTILAMGIANALGKPSLAIGSLGVINPEGNILEETRQTTNSYIENRKILYKFGKDYKYFFFEASSHGLEQKRFLDLKFDAIGWTNFSQDHLDYHNSIENYFFAKKKITSLAKNKLIISHGEEDLKKKLEENNENFDVALCNLNQKRLPLFFQMDYNFKNVCLAYNLNKVINSDSSDFDKINWEKIFLPQGRFEIRRKKDSIIVVDYAHTPQALKKICFNLKNLYKDYTLKVLFGAGGDRDKKKRFLMGETVSFYADFVYLTSDNPRQENPEKIIREIEKGLTVNYVVISDRKNAIHKSIEQLKGKEILLIAGKGHEKYQEIKGVYYPFNDIEIVQDLL